MNLTGIKIAFLFPGREGTSKEFQEQHFRELGPAEAGQCIRDATYQICDAFCEYGFDIERDPKITKTELDDEHKVAFCNLNYVDAYYLILERYKYQVFFILILSNSNSIFAFYNVA